MDDMTDKFSFFLSSPLFVGLKNVPISFLFFFFLNVLIVFFQVLVADRKAPSNRFQTLSDGRVRQPLAQAAMDPFHRDQLHGYVQRPCFCFAWLQLSFWLIYI